MKIFSRYKTHPCFFPHRLRLSVHFEIVSPCGLREAYPSTNGPSIPPRDSVTLESFEIRGQYLVPHHPCLSSPSVSNLTQFEYTVRFFIPKNHFSLF